MRLILLGFFAVAIITLLINIALKPIIAHDLDIEDNKTISINFLQFFNKLDYRYWVLKNNNNAENEEFESIYNVRILTNNNQVQSYANFEMLKKYQYFSDRDKSLLFQN